MVANAGVPHGAPFLELDEATWERVLAVNLKGVFLCGQAAARAMVAAAAPGAIVNVASTYAEVTEGEASAYSASKGGVRMLTKSMALELGPARDPRQRRRARLDPHRHEPARRPRSRSRSSSRRSRCSASACPRTSPT